MDNSWNYTKAENEALVKLLHLINNNPLKSNNNSKNEFGYIVERYFGLNCNELPVSDYNGIELKCRYINSVYPLRLFCCNFDSDNLFELKNVFEKYSTKKSDGTKSFNHSFFNTKISRINNATISKLYIDNDNKKIILKFYDNNYNVIYDKAFWSYDLLSERINIKLNHIILITYSIIYINSIKYYKIQKIDFYRLKSFDTFIKLITFGIIFISSSITSHVNEMGEEKIYNHGISFVIDHKNLDQLFYKTNSIIL